MGVAGWRVSLCLCVGASSVACGESTDQAGDPQTDGWFAGCLGGPGSVVTLAAGLDDPYVVSVDTAGIAWMERGVPGLRPGRLATLASCPGEPTTTHQGFGLSDLTRASDGFYVTVAGTMDPSEGAIARVPALGGDAQTLFSSENEARRIAIDGDTLFWIAYPATLVRGSTSGTERMEIWGPVGGFALAGPSIYLVSGAFDGMVQRISTLGTEAITLATTEVLAGGIAVDDTHVYWTVYGGTGLRRVPIHGGGEEVLVDGDPAAPQFYADVAIDDARVYWSDPRARRIRSTAKTGEDEWELPTTHTPGHLAIHEGLLYWAEPSSPGALMDGTINALMGRP